MKRRLPLLVCAAAGLAMVVQYYVTDLNWLGDRMAQWFQIIAGFAYVLGAGSLLMVNGRRVTRRAPGWGYNLVLIISLLITLYLGLFSAWLWPGYPGHQPIAEGTAFDWLYRYILTPLTATTYSLLAFFIASAAFRAFKARSLEATLLLATAFLVMLLRVPLGEALWNGLGLIDANTLIDRIIMEGFNTAGQRAVLLGASVGLISVSLKLLLGIERSYLGGD